jgi:U3 small nucleolar RNA-associated protein 12
VVIGTKIGKLFVVELASGVMKEAEGAHAGALWSVCVFPSGQGLATASADKTVKFWAFNLEEGVLSLSHVKTLEVCLFC